MLRDWGEKCRGKSPNIQIFGFRYSVSGIQFGSEHWFYGFLRWLMGFHSCMPIAELISGVVLQVVFLI